MTPTDQTTPIITTIRDIMTTLIDLKKINKSIEVTKIAKQTNMFAKINDVGKRVGIAVYSQAGESAFEGLQTSNEFRNQLIEQHKRGHFGIEPDAETLKKIDDE